ncbi:MAG: hypothetical protein ABI162_01695 [Luteolibacter sp.]
MSGTNVYGVSNDPQILIGDSQQALSLWSDSVVAPLTKLLPPGSAVPQRTKLCDNGLMILQKDTKTIQTLTPSDDSDGDGMPDDWEVYYGFNPAFDDANADADGDGISNYAEFLLRSDPHAAPVLNSSGSPIDKGPRLKSIYVKHINFTKEQTWRPSLPTSTREENAE